MSDPQLQPPEQRLLDMVRAITYGKVEVLIKGGKITLISKREDIKV
jgi:hypothetical protein